MEYEKFSNFQFDNICRTCLNKDEAVKSIFEVENTKEIKFIQALKECTSIQILVDDDLPKTLCQKCIDQVFNYYEFKKQSLLSEQKLRSIVQRKQNEIFKTEILDAEEKVEVLVEIQVDNSISDYSYLDDYYCAEQTNLQFYLNEVNKAEEINSNIEKESRFQRNECQESFPTKKELGNHSRRDETDSNIEKEKESRFQCNECQVSFPTKKELRSHSKSKYVEKKFKCDECDKSFLIPGRLRNHKLTHGFYCFVCLQRFESSEELVEHSKEHANSKNFPTKNELRTYSKSKHVEKKFKYDECDKSFSIPGRLRNHKLTHGFHCLVCFQQFESSEELEEHSKEHANSKNIPADSNIEKEKESRFQCNECQVSFPTKKELRSHSKFKHVEKKFKCDECDKSFLIPGRLRNHKLTHGIHCLVCFQRFESSEELEEHSKEHANSKNFSTKKELQSYSKSKHAEKKFKCDECDKSFSIAGPLRNHKLTHGFHCLVCFQRFENSEELEEHSKEHANSKKFVCRECGKEFNKKLNLQMHFMIHTGEKPYLCSDCGRAFTQVENLKSHARTHNGIRPYKCEYCNRGFAQWSTWKHHIVIHEIANNKRERTFICPECGKGFYRKTNLRNHCTSHAAIRKYNCPMCPNKFKVYSHLKRHLNIHTGEKMYSCPYCNKSFKRNTHLKIHIRSHTGERPYVCTMCNRGFMQRSVLLQHMKTHQRENYESN